MPFFLNPATGVQRGHIATLREERDLPPGLAEEARTAQFDPDLSSEEAQDLIRRLLNTPKLKVEPEQEMPGPGIYKFNDNIYRVKFSKKGRLYAEVLTIGLDGKGHFRYSAGTIMLIRPEMKATLEDAAQYGQQYGVCCVCGRILTNKDSIEAGIGPICAGRL